MDKWSTSNCILLWQISYLLLVIQYLLFHKDGFWPLFVFVWWRALPEAGVYNHCIKTFYRNTRRLIQKSEKVIILWLIINNQSTVKCLRKNEHRLFQLGCVKVYMNLTTEMQADFHFVIILNYAKAEWLLWWWLFYIHFVAVVYPSCQYVTSVCIFSVWLQIWQSSLTNSRLGFESEW